MSMRNRPGNRSQRPESEEGTVKMVQCENLPITGRLTSGPVGWLESILCPQ